LSAFSDAVSSIGMQEFDAALLQSTNIAAEISHFTVLEGFGEESPVITCAASNGLQENATQVNDTYLKHHWRKDPLRHINHADSSTSMKKPFLLSSENVEDGQYRNDCYDSLDIAQRLSFIVPHAANVRQINFFRFNNFGNFSSEEVKSLSALVPLLAALIDRHRRLVTPPWSISSLEERLGAYSPVISEREINVCSRILYGLSSEGIGLDLGIAKNTVLTHRRRAYAKLEICSQSDLFRLLDTH
jgi:LuxR family transcriptional regulator, activator of tox operons